MRPLMPRAPHKPLSPRRPLMTSHRHSSGSVETRASMHPEDANAQSAYYQYLLSSGQPEALIRRVQSGRYAMDAECARLYVDALNRIGQGSKALEYVIRGIQPHQHQQPKNSSSNINSHNGLMMGVKENPMHVISHPSPPKPRDRLMSTLRLALVAYISLAIITTYSDEISKAAGRPFSSASSMYSEIDPRLQKEKGEKVVWFDDVQGVDEVKQELLEIVEFLKDPGKFTRLGGKLPKGVLLSGPPGTGKTLLARAVAGEAGVPFIHCSGSEFDEMYVGVGAKRVRELFAAAKKRSPCIVFIDEIDAVGSRRNPKDQQFAKMTLNQLLVEMDGFSQTSGIIVMAATNYPEALDQALVRPGRFDRNVQVSLPDVQGRLAILKVHTQSVPLATDVKLSLIARGTPGFSGADLANLINYAALRAASTDQHVVTMPDLDWARDRILMGAERKAVMKESTRRQVAYHEAGHAILALYTPNQSSDLHKATIIPRGSALGMVSHLPEDDSQLESKQALLGHMDVCMAGRCAEELMFGPDCISTGASSDFDSATRIARQMVTQWGMGSPALGQVMLVRSKEDYAALSPETRAMIEKDVKRLVDESYERAKKMLREKRKEFERLAEGLLEYETLTRDEIERVVRGEQIRKDLDDTGRPGK